MGRGRARSSPESGGGEARPPEGRGGRRRTDGGSRGKAGVGGARGRGLPRTPPPPFTQRGPGTPLPARAAEPARACVLCSSLCCPDESLGRGSRGRRPACDGAGRGRALPAGPPPGPAGQPGRPPPLPSHRTRPPPPTPPPLTLPSAPARPPGRLCHAKAMAIGRLLGLTAAPELRLAEGKGAGAVRRRRPLGLQANPPLFFFSPPTPPPHTPGRVSLTHWLRCPSSPRLDGITSGGESPTSPGRAGWRWGRALLGETARGRFRVGATALAKGLSQNLRRPPFFRPAARSCCSCCRCCGQSHPDLAEAPPRLSCPRPGLRTRSALGGSNDPENAKHLRTRRGRENKTAKKVDSLCWYSFHLTFFGETRAN